MALLLFSNFSANAQWDSCYIIAHSADSSVIPLNDSNFNFHGTNNQILDSIFSHFGVIRYLQTNPSSQIDSIWHKYKIAHNVNSDTLIASLSNFGLFYKFEKINVNLYNLNSCTPKTVNDGWKDANVNLSDWYIKETNLECAWNITTGNSSVKIAIIDSDYDESHLEFTNNNHVFLNTFTVSPNHGTIVAGIVSAKADNNIGVAGYCHGCKTTVYEVTGAELEEGIKRALIDGNKVISLSWNTFYRTPQEIKEDISKGIIYVQAHGENKPSYIEEKPRGSISGFIHVGGSKQNLDFNDEFNWGPYLDLCAPSKGLAVLVKQGVNNNNGIICMLDGAQGVSFATPQVTGAVGLMLSVNPNLTPQQIECILKETATPFNPATYTSSQTYYGLAGTGILNVYEAVKRAQELALHSTDVVSSYQLINSSYVSDNDILITPTGELEIIGATIAFSLERKITVQAGGKLRLLNSTLTSNDCTNWEGIKIEGSQTGMQGYQLSTRTHAWVDVRNSTIENAKIGIETGPSFTPFEGGVFTVASSQFLNCRFGIKHNGFIDPSFPNFNPSFARESNFICDKPIPGYDNQGVNTHIWLYNVKGINFVANNYKNLIPQAGLNMNAVGRGRGIGAWEAGFKVTKMTASTPCTSIGLPSTFEGLGIAIHSGYGALGINFQIDLSRTTKIYDTEFNNNLISGKFLNDNATIIYNSNYKWDNNLPDVYNLIPSSDPIIGNQFSISRSGRRTDNTFNFNNTNHKAYETFVGNVHQDDGTGGSISFGSFPNTIYIDGEECKNYFNSIDPGIKSVADYFANDIRPNEKDLILACNTYRNNLFVAWNAEPNARLINQRYQPTVNASPTTYYNCDNTWETCLKHTNPGSYNTSIQGNGGNTFEEDLPCTPRGVNKSKILHDYTAYPIQIACTDLTSSPNVGSIDILCVGDVNTNPYCQNSKFYNEAAVYCSGPDGIPGTPDDLEQEENGGGGQGENMTILSGELDTILTTTGFNKSHLVQANPNLRDTLVHLFNESESKYTKILLHNVLIHFFDVNLKIPIEINLVSNQSNSENLTLKTPTQKSNNAFSFYPNPANNQLTVELKEYKKVHSIEILDVQGQLIERYEEISSNQIIFDIKSYKKGVYIINVLDGQKRYYSKFIKI